LRVERTRLRRGDNAQLARVSFVDDLKSAPVAKSAAVAVPTVGTSSATKTTAAKPAAKRTAAKPKPAATKRPAAKKEAK